MFVRFGVLVDEEWRSLFGVESFRLSCGLFCCCPGLVWVWDVLRVRLATVLERAAAEELVGVDWRRPAFRQKRRFSCDCGSTVKASDSSSEMWVMRRWGAW